MVSDKVKNYVLKECARCEGSGIDPIVVHGPQTCHACGGKGSILVAEPAQKCPSCDGTGWRHEVLPWTCGTTPIVVRKTCYICVGRGWLNTKHD